MEEHNEQIREEYVPRPVWQVWLARLALVILIVGIGLWLWNIAFPA